ncbi:MAG: hypothetical protein Q9202_000201 [Teloschistes flavicans]
MLTVSSQSIANGSTDNFGDPFRGLILRTDRRSGPNQFDDASLGLVAITALKEGALLDFDETLVAYEFTDEMHTENPVRIALTAEVRARSRGKIRRGTVMWAINAVVIDMLRTQYLRPLVFTVYYLAEHIYTGSIDVNRHGPASNTIRNQPLSEAPVDPAHVHLRGSASLREAAQYTLFFNFVPSVPGARPALSEYSVWECLLGFVLYLGQRDSGSITPRASVATAGLQAWVFMKEVVPPLQGFAFQQYEAVAIAEAIARFCVLHSRFDEMVFEFKANGHLQALGCMTKPMETRRWCGRMPTADSNDPPEDLTQSVAIS